MTDLSGSVNSRVLNAVQLGDTAALAQLLVDVKMGTLLEQELAFDLLRKVMANGSLAAFQIVLDAMSKAVILPADLWRSTLLSEAIEQGKKEVVLAVVERMRREAPYELGSQALLSLFHSFLMEDQEVVDAVVAVVPPAAYRPTHSSDVLLHVLSSVKDGERKERAAKLILKHGLTMEEMLKYQRRFHLVGLAAQYCGVEMVQMFHDLVPLLSDGSGRRGEVQDYADAVMSVSLRGYGRAGGAAIMEYLVNEGGGLDVLDQCDCSIVLHVRQTEDVVWLVSRAPHLLQEACRLPSCLRLLISRDATEYLAEQMVAVVDRQVIADVLRQPIDAAIQRKMRGGHEWMRKLRLLHEAVPESMDGLRWPWLMAAIEHKAYDDVEYMLGMCTRQHLVMRNKYGDSAYDMAAMDRWFPPELLSRLKVATKGSHS